MLQCGCSWKHFEYELSSLLSLKAIIKLKSLKAFNAHLYERALNCTLSNRIPQCRITKVAIFCRPTAKIENLPHTSDVIKLDCASFKVVCWDLPMNEVVRLSWAKSAEIYLNLIFCLTNKIYFGWKAIISCLIQIEVGLQAMRQCASYHGDLHNQ